MLAWTSVLSSALSAAVCQPREVTLKPEIDCTRLWANCRGTRQAQPQSAQVLSYCWATHGRRMT
jgi:hypothetical protein